MHIRPLPARALAWLLLLAAAAARAGAENEVERLLAAVSPPPGVVFEVVSGDESALERVLPAVREHARRLRERFPELPVAVLTHGSEQFSLLRDNAGRYAGVHALAAALREDDGVTVQVCGNHASWRGNTPADFPAGVEVVRAAGEKLSGYRSAGYVVIVM